jgi:hypothetical protein
MIARLLKDPITRIVTLLWLGLAALYFIPAVPPDFLERLGDRYSTLPLWPWAAAACLFGLTKEAPAPARRFWALQALSFAALLAIEVPWAMASASDTPAWNIAAEWCYFAYYACQFMSAARTRAGMIRSLLVSVSFAAALTAMALTGASIYNSARPSYFTYLAFDIAMTIFFWRLRGRSTGTWSMIFTGLAYTSALVFVTDTLDWLSYEEILHMVAGMKTDILWTLPPLGYALTARLGRLRDA